MIIFIVLGVIAIGGYIYLRNSLSTKGFEPVKQAAAAEPERAKNPLDIRPQIILKLQQLVKQGSDGLYNLSIKEVEPDILNSKLDVKNIVLLPDTTVLQNLERQQKAPDDVFKISCNSLHIDGLPITAFLSKEKIDVKTISLNEPVIEVFHQQRSYNKSSGDEGNLYQRISKEIKHIGIDNVNIRNGKIFSHDLKENTTTRFNDIEISLSKILIDSTTQYDKNRFLFAKEGEIKTKNFILPTSDHLYNFKFGTITIFTARKDLKATDVRLEPKYSRYEFSKHINKQKQWYQFFASSMELKNINWWKLMNKEEIKAEGGSINTAKLNLYYDLSLPPDAPHMHNFPHQLLMKVPIPITINRIKINGLDVSYQEYHPKVDTSGKLFFDKINGTITNITNVPERIKKNSQIVATASAIFMYQIPMTGTFRFNLANYKNGGFSASFTVSGFNTPVLNSLAEPFGDVMIKKGNVHSTKADIAGDNYHGHGKVLMLYNDLHLTPLKRDESRASGYKKKSVYSLLANKLVLKDDNPSGDKEPRVGEADYKRDPQGSFFNLVWKSALVGILKTIGAPERLAY